MKILAVDDRPLQRRALESAIREAEPEAEVVSYASAEEVLELADIAGIDVAFVDIDMPGMSGIELARELQVNRPRLNVVFATAYSEFMPDAFSLHSSGYLMKPITAAKVRAELDNLRYPLEAPTSKRLVVRCFGDFEVFAEGEPVAFERRKTKELLAYLVDRRGSMCSLAGIGAVFWGDRANEASPRSILRMLVADLRSTLDALGYPDVVVKRRGEIGVRPDALDCDYYAYLAGGAAASGLWRGEYMHQYSWAEPTAASLERMDK